jgi:hypothetical protein
MDKKDYEFVNFALRLANRGRPQPKRKLAALACRPYISSVASPSMKCPMEA